MDITNAEKDGVWDSSYISTGVYDQDVYDTLIGTGNTNNLGNGGTSHGYAIAGVEFTYLRVADIVQYTETAGEGGAQVQVLYGIDKTADTLDATKFYYQSDVLIDALASALDTNATTTKNAMESYVKAHGGTAMPLTDAYGKTAAGDLPLGLYLVAETKVPEMVVSSCNPFLLSQPLSW